MRDAGRRPLWSLVRASEDGQRKFEIMLANNQTGGML
jgi:hypothetical protein